jgi:hypothetical protein
MSLVSDDVVQNSARQEPNAQQHGLFPPTPAGNSEARESSRLDEPLPSLFSLGEEPLSPVNPSSWEEIGFIERH